MRKMKRFLSFLLTVMLLASMFNVPTVYAEDEETVVAWNYTAAPTPNARIAPATNGAKMGGAILTNSIPKDMTYSTQSLCLAGDAENNWTSGSEYWQIEFSTEGYKDLNIMAKGRSSGTGPRDFELQYSVDGGDFISVPDSAYSFTSTNLSYIKASPITLPAAINDKANVRIRFINISTTNVNGGTIASGGTSNINNIVINGIPTNGGTDPEPLNIKQVLDLPSGTTNVTVTGQIAYFANTYKNFTIQDVIDGQLYSLYIYKSNPEGVNVGDTVKITGTFKIYNGLPEMDSVSSIVKTGTQPRMNPETVTIADLLAIGNTMLGRFVKLEGVTLGKYSSSGNTPVTFGSDTINIYRGAPYPFGVEEGDVVNLYAMVSCFNSTIQLSTGTAEDNGFQVYELVNDTKPPVINVPDFLDAEVGQDYTISVEAKAYSGIKSVNIDYTIGDNVVDDQSMIKNTTTGKYEFTIPGSEIIETATELKFTITATGENNVTASTGEITVGIDSNPQIIDVKPEKNSYTGDNNTPEISVILINAGVEPSVKLSLRKGNDIIFENKDMILKSGESSEYAYTHDTPLAEGKYTAMVIVTRADSKSVSETWNFNVGTAVVRAYFGQLHSHTAQYSDGSGTLQDGLNYILGIPTEDNVDFVAFTDHSNYFDTTNAPNPEAALNDKSLMTSTSRAIWEEYVNTMTEFNAANDGVRTAIPGFEMTWSGGPGHINTFNSDGLVSRNNSALNNKSGDAGLKLYYETLVANTNSLANLSQFNHPGKTFGTFADFAYWNPKIDEKMFAVEVGNGEGGIGSGGYFPSYTEYTKALDKGWHVAPTNNQDNHKGYWGNSNTARTVIFTDENSVDGLLAGMYARAMYATEDKNLSIFYELNNHLMGQVINEIPTSPLKFYISIYDPDRNDIISKVEVITNGGRIVKSETFNSNSVNMEFELPVAKGYYYVRVTQADKNIAVTAPVWIGNAAIMGITSVECDTLCQLQMKN